MTGPRDVFDWDDLATEEALAATAWEFGPTNGPFLPIWDLPGTGLMLGVLAIDPALREPDDADRVERFSVWHDSGDGGGWPGGPDEGPHNGQFATLADALAHVETWLTTGPRRIPETLRAPVTDLASGKAWLAALVADGRTFHLEDNPADICNAEGQTFHLADVELIRERVAALYALEWGPDPMHFCPIGYLMHLEEAARPGTFAEGYGEPWAGY